MAIKRKTLAEELHRLIYDQHLNHTETYNRIPRLLIKYYEECSARKITNILDRLKASGSRDLFIIKYIKRTNGRLRVMRGRFNVTEYLRGGKLSYNPKQKNLKICFDVRKKEYRCINLEGLVSLSIKDKTYVVKKIR